MHLRQAFRMLAKSPGFTAIAVLTLALGIGINTVVFTIYGAVALKSIAARAPSELIRVSGSQDGQRLDAFSFAQYDQIRTQSHSIADVLATTAPETIAGRSEVLRGRLVTNNYFDALGVAPRLGRSFLPDDHAVAVVSYAYWTEKLHADPAVLGKVIRAQGTALEIVGVAPESFAGTGLPPRMPDLWIPASMQPEILPGVDWLRNDAAREWQILARRKPSVSVEQASAELDVLAHTWPLVNGKPAHLAARRATFFQTDSGEFETFGAVCKVLMVAVGLILLIGSINLVNLLFARHAMREHEFAVRLALAPAAHNSVRQLCTESALLGLLGGAAGLLFSLWSCAWIRLQFAGFLERISAGAFGLHLDLAPDWRVFAYTVAISLFTGIAIGVWPALHASRRDVSSALKQSSGGSAGRRSRRNLLLSAQVAGCLMLLTGAGLLFRGAWQSGTVDPGFEMKHLFLVGVDPKAVAPTAAARAALIRQAVDRIQALPEVASVAWSVRAPFLGHGSSNFRDERGVWISYLFNLVSDRYLETVGIPFLAGRNFTVGEVESGAPVMVISDAAARRIWPGKDPLGRSFRREDRLKNELLHDSYTVIGVVKGVRSTYLSKADEAFLYFPKPLSGNFGGLLVRTRTAPETGSRSILAALGTIDARLPSQTFVIGMEQGPVEIQKMMAEAPAMVASTLGTLALLLASVGVFGLVSQLVTRRTHEIAIRVSLGAQNREVVRLVLWQTLRPVFLGAAIGLAGAIGVSALLAAMVVFPDMPDLTYGAGAFHPATFCGALAMLMLVILMASYVPVRRATRIAPSEALRNE